MVIRVNSCYHEQPVFMVIIGGVVVVIIVEGCGNYRGGQW